MIDLPIYNSQYVEVARIRFDESALEANFISKPTQTDAAKKVLATQALASDDSANVERAEPSIAVANGSGKAALAETKLASSAFVNAALLKQAVVYYRANRRQGTVRTKRRSDVEGSTRKLYRQKGTGNARRGMIRTPIMKGGGHAHHKEPRDFRQALSKKSRRKAMRHAMLSKFLDGQVTVIDKLELATVKTKAVAGLLSLFSLPSSVLLVAPNAIGPEAREAHNRLWLSSRNISDLDLTQVSDLNAYSILRRRHILIVQEALVSLLTGTGAVVSQATPATASA